MITSEKTYWIKLMIISVKGNRINPIMTSAIYHKITKDMLSILNNKWDSQKCKFTNQNVAVYAPNNVYYSTTNPLEARETVAAGI